MSSLLSPNWDDDDDDSGGVDDEVVYHPFDHPTWMMLIYNYFILLSSEPVLSTAKYFKPKPMHPIKCTCFPFW